MEKRDEADAGYPEQGPPGSAPDDAGPGQGSAVRERSKERAREESAGPPDDHGKATGNPNN